MQTYTFDELSKRAKGHAVRLYCSDPEILAILDRSPRGYGIVDPAFRAVDWRYTEHGERIA